MSLYTIGIMGNHGSGKSTLSGDIARILYSDESANIYNISFASPIRKGLSQVTGVAMSSEKKHPYERNSLVYVGETKRRKWSATFIKDYIQACDSINMDKPNSLNFVITDDVYHYNEASLMDKLLVVENTNYEYPQEDEYWPDSVSQTKKMLDMAREGTLPFSHVYISGNTPEEISKQFSLTNFMQDVFKESYERYHMG